MVYLRRKTHWDRARELYAVLRETGGMTVSEMRQWCKIVKMSTPTLNKARQDIGKIGMIRPIVGRRGERAVVVWEAVLPKERDIFVLDSSALEEFQREADNISARAEDGLSIDTSRIDKLARRMFIKINPWELVDKSEPKIKGIPRKDLERAIQRSDKSYDRIFNLGEDIGELKKLHPSEREEAMLQRLERMVVLTQSIVSSTLYMAYRTSNEMMERQQYVGLALKQLEDLLLSMIHALSVDRLRGDDILRKVLFPEFWARVLSGR